MDTQNVIIACPDCRTRNRIPLAKIRQNPVCARCRASLSNIPWYPVNCKDAEFETAVLKQKGPVLVDCWAPWCGPCKSMGPVMDQLARDYAGRVRVIKVNMDDNPLTGDRYGVRSIPTLLFFRDGQMLETVPGAVPRGEIERRLQSLL